MVSVVSNLLISNKLKRVGFLLSLVFLVILSLGCVPKLDSKVIQYGPFEIIEFEEITGTECEKLFKTILDKEIILVEPLSIYQINERLGYSIDPTYVTSGLELVIRGVRGESAVFLYGPLYELEILESGTSIMSAENDVTSVNIKTKAPVKTVIVGRQSKITPERSGEFNIVPPLGLSIWQSPMTTIPVRFVVKKDAYEKTYINGNKAVILYGTWSGTMNESEKETTCKWDGDSSVRLNFVSNGNWIAIQGAPARQFSGNELLKIASFLIESD